MKKRFCSALIFSILISTFSNAQMSDKQTVDTPQIEPFRISKGKSFSASVPRTSGNTSKDPYIVNRTTIQNDLIEALDLIQRNHVANESTNSEELIKSSIEGMLRILDPHSSYFDAREYSDLLNEQHSEYFGIGATIANFRNGEIFDTYVTSTFPDSPAFRAGLNFGDRIVSVNGEDVSGKNSLYVRNRIRGNKGTVLRLTIERNSTTQIETLVIRRNRVAQPSVADAYILSPGIGYIDLSAGFNYTTIEELNVSLHALHKLGMTSLILDLRDNPGGILEQAIRVAEKFLPRGSTIATQRGRFVIDNRTWRSNNLKPENLPLIVLVNDESASASEIVAGALQDYDRALIIGENTFGKGLVQSVINLPYGAGLTLTTAKYFTPSGRLIQRDYSRGNLYDYYQHNEKSAGVGAKIANRTIGGRTVYSGDGIAPDIVVKAPAYSDRQAELLDAIFHFSLELTGGRIEGLESYRVGGQKDVAMRIREEDYPVTPEVLSAFAEFVRNRAKHAISEDLLKTEARFIGTRIRYNLLSAAYGNITAKQALIESDVQILKSIESVPRARQMSRIAEVNLRKSNSFH
ncbi:MAG: S41 family peptidase [Pyrinomonadaceae bacterium]